MLIGHDKIGEATYLMKKAKKKHYLDELIELCSKVVDINDTKQFAKSPSRYVIEQAKIKTGLGSIKEEEFLKLVDLPLSQINQLFDRYESFNVDLDSELTFDITIDSKEEIELFKKLEKLCKAINELEYPIGQTERIKQALNNSIELSEEAKFIPSWRYIASVKNMIF
jgi:methyl-accepting chemotaxis protein